MKRFLSYAVLATLASSPAIADEMADKVEKGKHHGAPGIMLKKMDTDGDSKVSRAEFDTFQDKMFTKLDKNGDGFISEDDKAKGDGEGVFKEGLSKDVYGRLQKMKDNPEAANEVQDSSVAE